MNKTNKKFKDPGSAITHLIAMIGAVICAFPLIGKAVHTNNSIVVFAMSVFISSMILLYGASTLYHSLDISKKVNLFFRRIDHSMIFVLIAGSYTPVCLIVLGGKLGYTLLALVWGIAAVGMLVKACWITCPKWFSSIIYSCLTEPAGFSLIPRTFFPIPTAPEDTTIISFPLGWLLIPFRFSSFQFIFLVGINKRSRKRVCGDTFFCFFFHYRIIILQ